jgi:tricorn protease
MKVHHLLSLCRDWVFLVLLFLVAQVTRSQSVQRGEMEDVLKIVSTDVQNNFYDAHMKGLDWPALTEETRQRIHSSNNQGQMILAIFSLLSKLGDSHTYFVPPRLTQQADFGFKARSYGDDILVYEVTDKGPAAKSGLGVGDKILSLNGIPVDRNNIVEVLPVLEMVVPAAALDIEIVPSGGQPRRIHVPAHMIITQELQYVDSVWRVEDQQRARDVQVHFSHKDYGDGIIYVAVPSFNGPQDATYSAIKEAEHARALVLDLRGNHGGRADTLLAFLGFFSTQPRLLARKVLRSQSEDLTIKPRYSGFNGSIVVLVDSDSASAAELAARHLQINYEALVIGDRTSGRVNDGHVIPGKIGARFVMPFAVVVTEAKLVMPDGEELEGHGVIPDSQCVPTPEDLLQRRDPCLDQAIAQAKKLILAQPTRTN